MDFSGAQQRLEEALELAESGRKQEAQKRFRALVAEGARLPKAAMALGVLCGERGDRKQRCVWLLHARQLELEAGGPCSVRLLLNLLVDAYEAGDGDGALAYGREALEHYPDDPEVLWQMGHLLLQVGQGTEGRQLLEKAAHRLRGPLDEGPGSAKEWWLLARVEEDRERLDAALESCRQALALDCNHLPSLLTLSRLLSQRGRVDEALPWLTNALAVDPENARVLTLLGQALKNMGEPLQAVELLQQALVIDPSLTEAHFQLGACLSDLGLYEDAEQQFREGLTSSPDDLDCKMNLGSTLRNRGDMEAAAAIFRELVTTVPQANGAFYNLMFTYSISDVATPELVLATARDFWQAQAASRKVDRGNMPKTFHPWTGRLPLRVGFLSADIGNHVVGRFLNPLLRHHDPQRCRMELVSMQRRYERSSEDLIALADGFHSLEGLPEAEGRARLQELGYDLIVDTSGFTSGTGLHLLSERCSPVQVHYIGYHATLGLPAIDWFLGDGETAAPELQPQFSEKLWRLDRPWLAYPTEPPFPEATALMATERPVLGAFCQLPKISDCTLEFWGAALHAVPEALLVLKDRGLHDETVRTRMEKRLGNLGVHANRVVFLPPAAEWADHVDLYNVLDVAMDSSPWSSATTAFEALAMGTPLVAIRGNRMASRMSSSVVRGLGRPEWIAETPVQFAERVAFLCEDIPKLRADKAERQKQMLASSLFDGADLARQVEDALLAMARWRCELADGAGQVA
jgi:predicted O-linked N-acetylglucosamine transferase (SPINDLY family)